MSRTSSGRIHSAEKALELEEGYRVAVILDDAGRLFVRDRAALHVRDGLFGPNTLFLEALDWKADGVQKPGGEPLEVNPARILAIVG